MDNTHPNLLFTAPEIEAIREKISRYSWAQKLFERLKVMVDGGADMFCDKDDKRFTMTYPLLEQGCIADRELSEDIGLLMQSLAYFSIVAAARRFSRYATRFASSSRSCRARFAAKRACFLLPRESFVSCAWFFATNASIASSGMRMYLPVTNPSFYSNATINCDLFESEGRTRLKRSPCAPDSRARMSVNAGSLSKPARRACSASIQACT